MDLIGSSAVTIKGYDTIVHKRKLVLELTQEGFPTNCPPRWLALYGYLQFSWEETSEVALVPYYLHIVSNRLEMYDLGIIRTFSTSRR